MIKTLCNRCLQPLVCEWPDRMEFAGQPVTAAEYMAKAMRNDHVVIACDSCLAKMTDVQFGTINREPK